jgi:hypothetical protein
LRQGLQNWATLIKTTNAPGFRPTVRLNGSSPPIFSAIATEVLEIRGLSRREVKLSVLEHSAAELYLRLYGNFTHKVRISATIRRAAAA